MYATDAGGALTGGIALRVDAHHRGTGPGNRLLARAEELAGNERD
ncbi:hypothetical protein ACH4U6_18150 [Streptomyces netropsis]